MDIDHATLSETLEVLGRSLLRGQLSLEGTATARARGAVVLAMQAAQDLDKPPKGGWPGEGTVLERRTRAHLAMFSEEALGNATRKARPTGRW